MLRSVSCPKGLRDLITSTTPLRPIAIEASSCDRSKQRSRRKRWLSAPCLDHRKVADGKTQSSCCCSTFRKVSFDWKRTCVTGSRLNRMKIKEKRQMHKTIIESGADVRVATRQPGVPELVLLAVTAE